MRRRVQGIPSTSWHPVPYGAAEARAPLDWSIDAIGSSSAMYRSAVAPLCHGAGWRRRRRRSGASGPAAGGAAAGDEAGAGAALARVAPPAAPARAAGAAPAAATRRRRSRPRPTAAWPRGWRRQRQARAAPHHPCRTLHSRTPTAPSGRCRPCNSGSARSSAPVRPGTAAAHDAGASRRPTPRPLTTRLCRLSRALTGRTRARGCGCFCSLRI